MGKSILAVIKDEKLVITFDGFSGDECHAESEALRKKLRELGVVIEVESEVPKPQIPVAVGERVKVGG